MNSTTLQQMNIQMIIEYFTNLLNNISLVPEKFQLSRVDVNTYIFDFSFDWLKYDFSQQKLKNLSLSIMELTWKLLFRFKTKRSFS